jgi:hypothetical protein
MGLGFLLDDSEQDLDDGDKVNNTNSDSKVELAITQQTR